MKSQCEFSLKGKRSLRPKTKGKTAARSSEIEEFVIPRVDENNGGLMPKNRWVTVRSGENENGQSGNGHSKDASSSLPYAS